MTQESDDPKRKMAGELQLDREAMQPLVKFLEGLQVEIQSEEGLEKWQKLEQSRNDELSWHQMLYIRPLDNGLEVDVVMSFPQLSEDDPARDAVEQLINSHTTAYVSGNLYNNFPALVQSSRKERENLAIGLQERFEGKDLISLKEVTDHFLLVDSRRYITFITPLIAGLGYILRHSPGFEPTNWTPIGKESVEMVAERENRQATYTDIRAQAIGLFQLLGQ